VVVQLA